MGASTQTVDLTRSLAAAQPKDQLAEEMYKLFHTPAAQAAYSAQPSLVPERAQETDRGTGLDSGAPTAVTRAPEDYRRGAVDQEMMGALDRGPSSPLAAPPLGATEFILTAERRRHRAAEPQAEQTPGPSSAPAPEPERAAEQREHHGPIAVPIGEAEQPGQDGPLAAAIGERGYGPFVVAVGPGVQQLTQRAQRRAEEGERQQERDSAGPVTLDRLQEMKILDRAVSLNLISEEGKRAILDMPYGEAMRNSHIWNIGRQMSGTEAFFRRTSELASRLEGRTPDDVRGYARDLGVEISEVLQGQLEEPGPEVRQAAATEVLGLLKDQAQAIVEEGKRLGVLKPDDLIQLRRLVSLPARVALLANFQNRIAAAKQEPGEQ